MPQVRKAEPPTVQKTITRTIEQVLPPPDQDRPQRPDISEWFASLTPEGRAEHTFYLKRLEPDIVITDPRVTNPAWKGGKYLYRFTSEDLKAFEGQEFWAGLQEWTRQRFGGSNYRLMVTNHKVGTAVYSLPMPIEGDPILSTREGYRNAAGVIGTDPRTGVENIVLAFLKEQLESAKQKALDPSAAVETAIAMMAKANDRALEMALKQVPQQASPIDTMTAMIESLNKMGYFKKSDDEALAAVREELRLLRAERDKQPPHSVWEELKAAKEGLAVLGYGRGSGSNSGENGWVAVAQALAPALEKIADKILATVSARNLAVAPLTRVTTPAPLGTPGPLGSIPAPPAIPPGPPPPPPPEQDAFANQVVSGYLFSKIRERFEAGHTGDAVAEWLDETERPLANQLGYLPAEQLHALMRQHPILASLADHPRAPAFIKEFLSYFKDDGPESGEAEAGKAA